MHAELPEAGAWSVTSAKNGVNAAQSIVIGTQSMKMPLYLDSFADNTWEEIIAVCRTGIAPDSWAVGDSKTMTIGGTAYQVDIIGKNHDEYADGSGTAPLTFQLHDCYSEAKQMYSSNLSGLGWKNTDYASDLPACDSGADAGGGEERHHAVNQEDI